MNTILTPDEARKYGRPIGKVSDEKLYAFIIEVEQTIIRKSLGDELYIKIIDSQEFSGDIALLIDGGRYKDECGNTRLLSGLKVAEAYFVYAQNVRAGDYESTRYGMVVKNDDYSTGLSSKERDALANNATEIANAYLRECKAFCRAKGIPCKDSERHNMNITSGCVIRKIRHN